MINKTQVKATVAYTVLNFLPYASNFLLLPIITEYLTTGDYGVITLATVTQSYLILIVVFGLDRTIGRLYFDYNKSREESLQFLNVSLTLILTISAFVGLILLCYGEEIFYLIWQDTLPFMPYGWFIYGSSVFIAMNWVLFQYYRVSENLKLAIALSISPFLLSMTGGVLGIVLFKMGAIGNVAGKAIGLMLGALPFYLYIFAKRGFIFKWDIVKNIFHFSYPILFFVIINNTSEVVDKIILNKLISLSELGVYSFAITLVSPIGILVYAYYGAVSPSITNALVENEKGRNEKITNFFSMLFLVTFISSWGLIAVIYPVIMFFAKQDYSQAAIYIPLLVFKYFGYSYSYIYSFGIFHYKKTKILPVINLFSLVVTGMITYLFTRQWGIMGACVGVSISQIPLLVVTYFIDKKVSAYPIYPFRKTMLLIGVSILVITINYSILYKIYHQYISWINLLEGVVLVTIAVLLNFEYIKKQFPSLIR